MKPWGLRVTTAMCLALGIGLIVGLVLTPLDLAIYSVNGQALRGREFLRLFGAPAALLGVSLTVAGWGLWHERPWARIGLMAALASAAAAFTWMASIDGTAAPGALLWRWLVLLALAGLYLYRAAAVRAYFEGLARGTARRGA